MPRPYSQMPVVNVSIRDGKVVAEEGGLPMLSGSFFMRPRQIAS